MYSLCKTRDYLIMGTRRRENWITSLKKTLKVSFIKKVRISFNKNLYYIIKIWVKV